MPKPQPQQATWAHQMSVTPPLAVTDTASHGSNRACAEMALEDVPECAGARVQAQAQRTRQRDRRRWQPTSQGMVHLAGQTAARTQQDEAPSCGGQKLHKTSAEKVLMANFFAQKFCMHPAHPLERMVSRLGGKASGSGGVQMRRYR